jgi:chaperonin GroEL
MNIRDCRIIDCDKQFHERIAEGVDAISNITKETLGPKGRNILVEKKYGVPDVTKDGVSVAREIFLDDSVSNLAAQLLKQAAVKTNEGSGDGTTTAIVLAQAIYHAGRKQIENGVSPVVVKNMFERATDKVVNFLKENSREVEGEELRHVARIAANSNELGDIVYDILGDDPNRVVVVEESSLHEHEVNQVDGLRIENGFMTGYMVNEPQKMEAVMDKAAILVNDGKITSMDQLLPTINLLVSNSIRKLLIVTDEISSDPLMQLVQLHITGQFHAVAVKSPNWGKIKTEMLRDIAAVTGATVFGTEEGGDIYNPSLEHLGSADKVLVKEHETVITGGKGDVDLVAQRLKEVQKKYDECDSQFDKNTYSLRIAKLSGGVTIFKVGGKTESEMQEALDRVEDAIQSVVAASQEGVLPGGGNALLYASYHFADGEEDRSHLETEFAEALSAPYRQILENAAIELTDQEEEFKRVPADLSDVEFNKGVNVKTGVETDDLMQDGVIDPTKVTRTALQNGSSVACQLLMGSGSVTFISKGDKRTESQDM